MENNESKPTAKTPTKRGRKPKKKVEGLGDAIEVVTEATGIKAIVDWFSDATGIDCGCDARKEKLNKLFPIKKPLCLVADEYEYLKQFFSEKRTTLVKSDQRMVAVIHSRVFTHNYLEPCTCNPKIWKQWIADLEKVYNEYKEQE